MPINSRLQYTEASPETISEWAEVRVIATVMALPSPEMSGRLLWLLNSIGEVTETSSLKRAKKKSSYNVTEIMPLELRLKFGIGFYGRVHITEVNDNNVLEKPFGNFKVGQTITARIVGKPNQKGLKFVQHLSGLKFALLFLLYFFTSWYVLVLLL
ncbi:hypothetical protein ES319_D06G105900v1 [Gossypium barbadense]|uniref:S1 motif domain-containing protein n=1 Tax=Gossypium barbadense TaxID=3634 RepID=A0A5J5R0A5_GOSBA|nr:hypothetical protein ES319_D06G105900v1 [Gossypium barbadense]